MCCDGTRLQQANWHVVARRPGAALQRGAVGEVFVVNCRGGDRTVTEASPDRNLNRLVRLSAPTLRRVDIERQTGVDSARTVRWWRAMGFAVLDPDAPGFGAADVAIVRRIAALEDAGLVSDESVLRLARLLGSTFSRVAEAQVELLDEVLAGLGADTGLSSHERLAAIIDAADDDVLDLMESAVTYVWRRHLSSALATRLRDDATESMQAVGFVDLSGFTRLGLEIGAGELADLVDAFESATFDVLSEHGARVVKLIGDEVLFVADSLEMAVDAVLELNAVLGDVPGMPMTHSGVAYGHTINLGGDVYGATVNLAARLRSVARPGAIALAREQAQVMEDRPDLVLRKIRRTYDFKGIGRTRISTVSRNPEYVAEAEAEAVEREVEPTREEPPSTG